MTPNFHGWESAKAKLLRWLAVDDDRWDAFYDEIYQGWAAISTTHWSRFLVTLPPADVANVAEKVLRGMERHMSQFYHWTFKYNGEPWKVTAWAVGRKPIMCSPGEFDRVWGWGIWAGHTPKLIASGEITGQLDELPHLSAILLDWQAMIAGAVVTAIETAKPGHERPAVKPCGAT